MSVLAKRALVRPVAFIRVAADRASYRDLMRLRAIDAHTGEGEKEVELRIGRLSGRPVWVREGTADVDTLWDVFVHGYHVPPARVQRRGMRLIWDLGANIGLTMADMALRWPEARVVGVELDADNAALARRNFEPWDDRCELIEAAAWPEDGETWYHRWPGATSAYQVHAPTPGEEPHGPVVPTLSLDTLLDRYGGGPVSYVKMDVEGAERELLTRNTGWAAHVGCIKVEVHGDYSPDDCSADLERLGFDARRDRRHDAAVVGVRDIRSTS
jgi:FkbM family methyltransferase